MNKYIGEQLNIDNLTQLSGTGTARAQFISVMAGQNLKPRNLCHLKHMNIQDSGVVSNNTSTVELANNYGTTLQR